MEEKIPEAGRRSPDECVKGLVFRLEGLRVYVRGTVPFKEQQQASTLATLLPGRRGSSTDAHKQNENAFRARRVAPTGKLPPQMGRFVPRPPPSNPMLEDTQQREQRAARIGEREKCR